MFNVELAKKVQVSILDQSKGFNMGDWDCCIAGHTLQVAGVVAETVPEICGRARRALGLEGAATVELFESYTDPQDRLAAVAKLQRLIDQAEKASTPPASSALEPRSRSARAEEAVEACFWTAMEVKEEEPELVGV